ncbi:MraY family glycosyltransferase [Candidatus Omnitrophota bacterium]
MVNYTLLILTFCSSLIMSFLLTPLMRNIAFKTEILSRPGRRSVHVRSIPYLGGLAIYFAFTITILIASYISEQFRLEFYPKLTGLIMAGTLIVILGLWDDIKNIQPIIKLTGQIAVALLLFGYGFRVEVLTNPFTGVEVQVPLYLSILITTAWIVGLINAINLIDGLDGLAAGITFIVCGALFFIALYLNNQLNVFLLAILAGSVLGFLRYNFHPAKIFMGDAGSMFLGMMLASIALIRSQHKSAVAAVLLVPIAALAIPIYDTLVAAIRRLLKKGSIFKADKKHLHHRLLSTGLTQKQIVLFMYLVTLYLGIFAFLFVLIPSEYALILLLLLALGLFMASRIIGFVERNARLIHRAELKRRKHEI